MNVSSFSFHLENQSSESKARTGRMHLGDVTIHTPLFMPVGTLGTVKTLTGMEVYDLNFPLILNNTYHLYLRPGINRLKEIAGIRSLTKYPGCILTDSGGYQLFSLSKFCKVTEEGVQFSNHLDGSYTFFTPESVIDIQSIIGSDIMMPLDHLTNPHVSLDVAKDASDRTYRWAKRTKEYLYQWENPPIVFGIAQGNVFPEIRAESTERLVELDFPGYAIGGLSVGEATQAMYELIHLSTDLLPANKVRYLMGVGEPADLLKGILLGVDIFDCVFPTRVARNGLVFSSQGRVNLLNQKHQFSQDPIDAACTCYTCTHFSRMYLRHLFKTSEMLGMRLATIHNLFFMNRLIQVSHQKIQYGGLKSWVNEMIDVFKPLAALD